MGWKKAIDRDPPRTSEGAKLVRRVETAVHDRRKAPKDADYQAAADSWEVGGRAADALRDQNPR